MKMPGIHTCVLGLALIPVSIISTVLSFQLITKNLKVDYLKIDGAFVRDIDTNTLDRSMVDSIYRIGHQMGLVTVAEYVETDQVLAILRQIGVEGVQGNLLHRPQSMQTFWQVLDGAPREMRDPGDLL